MRPASIVFQANIIGNQKIYSRKASPRFAHPAILSGHWFIACMFSDAKTKGLNLEDTRMTLSKRLSVLVGIFAISIAMACHTASKLMGSKYYARKKHGYCSKSRFRTGLDELCRRLRTDDRIPIFATKIAMPKRWRSRVV